MAAEHRRLDGVHDVDAWRRAVETWQEIGEPYPEARARVRMAEALLATQAPRAEIEEQLRSAAIVADRLRATSLRDDVDRIARWARVDIDLPVAGEPETDAAATAEPAPVPFALTPRELEVLAFVADGRTNSQIAEALFINQKTASVHVSNILSKLGVGESGRGGRGRAPGRSRQRLSGPRAVTRATSLRPSSRDAQDACS